jgi:hypothetical protein
MTNHEIARLFDQERRLEAQLVLVRARISAARRDYSAREGLLAFPSVDKLRKAVGR